MSPSTACARARLLSVVSILFLVAGAVAAETPRWTLRLGGLASDYEHRIAISALSEAVFLELEGGTGLELAMELRTSPRVGWQVSVARLDLDAHLFATRLEPISLDPLILEEVTVYDARGSFGIEPLAVGFLFHPFPEKRFDLRLGPEIAWVRFRVGADRVPDRDSEPAWGLRAGGDLRLGESPWSLGLELRHLEIQHDATDRDLYTGIALDTAAVTIGYRLRGSRS